MDSLWNRPIETIGSAVLNISLLIYVMVVLGLFALCIAVVGAGGYLLAFLKNDNRMTDNDPFFDT